MCHRLWVHYIFFIFLKGGQKNFIWAHTCLELAGRNKSSLLIKPEPFPSRKQSQVSWEEPGFLAIPTGDFLAALRHLTRTLAAWLPRRSQLSMHLLQFSSQENLLSGIWKRQILKTECCISHKVLVKLPNRMQRSAQYCFSSLPTTALKASSWIRRDDVGKALLGGVSRERQRRMFRTCCGTVVRVLQREPERPFRPPDLPLGCALTHPALGAESGAFPKGVRSPGLTRGSSPSFPSSSLQENIKSTLSRKRMSPEVWMEKS